MPRKKLNETLVIDVELEDDRPKRPYVIQEASIKDDFCHYNYEIIDGVGKNDVHKVKSTTAIVKDDLKEAFAAFNIHMAIIDDVFKNSDIEIEDLTKFAGHEYVFLYTVTGFKISGSEDNESIILRASKYLSTGGRMELESPKIPIDSLSSYKWKNELKAAADHAREEVALYKEGKYFRVEEEENEEDLQQTKIVFDHPAEQAEFNDSEFENAAV